MSGARGPDHCPEELTEYLALAGAATGEIRIQRSRFVCHVAPVETVAAARSALAEMARLHHDARHLCHAWRLGPPDHCREARNDAGEPAGTAGEPILAALRQAGLTNGLAVVARYFGGIKLGTGGLARAYGEAAAAVIKQAGAQRILIGVEADLGCGYAQEKTLSALLARHRGRKLDQSYAATITWRIWLPRPQQEAFVAQANEATAGGVTIGPLVRSDRPARK